MKKIFTLLFTFSLVFTLAACSGQTVSRDQSQTSEQSLQTEAAESAQSTTTGEVDSASTSTVAIVSAEQALANTHDSSDDYVWDTSGEIDITLNDESTTADNNAVSVNGSLVTITTSGNYRISGALSDGQIVVNTADDGLVRLILDGVTLSNSSSSAILIENAEKVMLILAENSTNQVSDGSTYTYVEAGEDEPNAAIFSKSDLTIWGSGSLIVNANDNDGISSKNGLIIAGGVISINAADDGIRGKDYLVVKDGNLEIIAQGDALKSDNEDETAPGFITILAGAFNINSGNDGMDAVGDVTINGGSFSLVTGGGSNATLSETASAKGIKSAANITIENGIFNLNSADDTLNANGALTIHEGSYTMASGDDAIHADTSLTINTAEMVINQSYEGLESALININGGTIHITSSDDGINISNGNDASGMGGMDGMPGGGMGPGGGENRPFGGGENPPAGAGNQPADGGAMPQGGAPVNLSAAYANSSAASTSNNLYIRSGYVVINAGGDGVDANGGIEMSGGTLLINGPTENMNSAIDYTTSFVMTGGLLVAVGSSGMAQVPDSSSTQNSILVNFSSAQNAGTLIHIQDSMGKDILTYESVKPFQSIAFSSAELVTGTDYTFSLGGSYDGSPIDNLYQGGSYSAGTIYTNFNIADVVTSIGSTGRNR